MSGVKSFNAQIPLPIALENRSYRLIQLPNGIFTLLICDASEQLASCSLSVATGHHADPEELPGLAHLCEHMVCISSKEYPEIDAYRKTVHQAGGSFNAVTIAEKTTFYFEVPTINDVETLGETVFTYLLKVFSSCFRTPLFNQSYTNREIMAVDNEHTKNRSALGRLTYHGLRLLANPEHQFHRFATGNFYSLHDACNLKKLNIRDQLVKFFAKEYVPSKMTLVLRGPQSLNILQKLAISNFGTITNAPQSLGSSRLKVFASSAPKNAEVVEVKSKYDDFDIVGDFWAERYTVYAFTPPQLGKIVLIDNQTTSPILRVVFPVNKLLKTGLASKQLEIYMILWSNIFGDESSTSLSAIYFKKNYIQEIVASSLELSNDTKALELQLKLSPLGVQNIDSILTILFDYASTVFDSRDKIVKRMSKLLSQYNSIDLYNYLYDDVSNLAAIECRDLSRRLLGNMKALSKWLIKGSPNWDFTDAGYSGGYDENENAKKWWFDKAEMFNSFVLNTVNSDNVIVSYIAQEANFNLIKSLSNCPDSFQQDEYFGFNYKIADIKLTKVKYDDEIMLPRPNPFAPDITKSQTKLLKALDVTARNSSASTLGFFTKDIDFGVAPSLIYSNPGCQLWLKKETNKVYKNKAFLSLDLTNCLIEQNALNSICSEILCNLAKDKLRQVLYPALELGYSYDLFPSIKGDTGFSIHISGPVNKIYEVLSLMVLELKTISNKFDEVTTSESFEEAKVRLKLKYEGLNDMPSISVATLGLMVVMEEYSWSLEDRYEALEELNFKIMSKFSSEVFCSCYLSSLLHGDVEEKTYKNEIIPILQQLILQYYGDQHVTPSTVLLPEGSNYHIHRPSPDETSALVYYTQTGLRDDSYTATLTKFLSFVLSTTFSTKLRGQYQLGYAVAVGTRALRETVGIHVSIMSGEYTPQDLDAKVDDIIMEWYNEFFKNLAEASFVPQYIKKFVNSYINSNHRDEGMTSLTMGSIGANLGDSTQMKQHQAYWDQILNRSYKFSKDLTGEDSIDLSLIEDLKLSEFINFTETRFLPSSKSRSKVSIMLKSKSSKEDVENMMKPIRLYMFLTAAGLPIKREKIVEIVEKSGDSQAVLTKELFKYYQSDGSSWRLITALLAKLGKGFLESRKTSTLTDTGGKVSAVKIVAIDDLKNWQSDLGFYRDGNTMATKLQKLSMN